MNRLLILLFGVVSTVAVLILLWLLYRYATEEVATGLPKSREFSAVTQNRSSSRTSGPRWLEELAAKKRTSYAYPVSEMEVDLPLVEKPRPHRAFRLRLKHLDNYKMFCVRQVLDQHGIRYAVYKEGEEGVLVIHDLDRASSERIKALVREYDVKIETENYVVKD